MSFSETEEQLIDILPINREFVCCERNQETFEAVCKALTSPLTLANFDDSLDTYMMCDATAPALGAILSQKDRESVERLVAYSNLPLTLTERAYSIGEQKALACI